MLKDWEFPIKSPEPDASNLVSPGSQELTTPYFLCIHQ